MSPDRVASGKRIMAAPSDRRPVHCFADLPWTQEVDVHEVTGLGQLMMPSYDDGIPTIPAIPGEPRRAWRSRRTA